jgi:hypothetical protein
MVISASSAAAALIDRQRGAARLRGRFYSYFVIGVQQTRVGSAEHACRRAALANPSSVGRGYFSSALSLSLSCRTEKLINRNAVRLLEFLRPVCLIGLQLVQTLRDGDRRRY